MRHRLLPTIILALSLLYVGAATLACGSEGEPIGAGSPEPDPSEPSGSGRGIASERADGGTDTGVAVGTCSFVLREESTRRSRSGVARARMNGSGNLLVRCVGEAGESEREAMLELGFGNGTLDGPREYLADDFSSDGSVRYESSDRIYWSNTKGSSCVLVLTEAPVDGLTRTVPKGKRIAATFRCDSLVADSDDGAPPIVIESGSVAALVE